MRLVPQGPGIPIPKPPEKLLDISSDYEEEDDGSDDDFKAAGSHDPQLFSQSELNDLDSRERSQHWIKREWTVREKLEIGIKNVIEEALVDREKILLPPLHLKLSLIKQFVKALDKEGRCFKHLLHAFPGLSAAKVKEGVFVGPDIRKLMEDEKYEACLANVEKEAWRSFKEVVKKFLGNYNDHNFKHNCTKYA
ncbi:hypothetical protein AVEN_14878-1 [Araneus ventricosus]|uniref:Uncharacterized protein n=1 Tax=Araneus ventricosus TaxID=182803 RepID=A0A4Y2F7H5_ARAVE|nr:hypothetical protein AVEN_14878-1 [Araneus ventricosus]